MSPSGVLGVILLIYAFIADHEPTAIQLDAGAPGLHGQRADRADPRPVCAALYRHLGYRRNLQLPRSAVRAHLLHAERRTRAVEMRVLQESAAHHEVPPGGRAARHRE